MGYEELFFSLFDKVNYAKSLNFKFDKNLSYVDYFDLYKKLFIKKNYDDVPEFSGDVCRSDFTGFCKYNKNAGNDTILYMIKGHLSYIQSSFGEYSSQSFLKDDFVLSLKFDPNISDIERKAKFLYDRDFFAKLIQKGEYDISILFEGYGNKLLLDFYDEDNRFYVDFLKDNLDILKSPYRVYKNLIRVKVAEGSYIKVKGSDYKNCKKVEGYQFGDLFLENFII